MRSEATLTCSNCITASPWAKVVCTRRYVGGSLKKARIARVMLHSWRANQVQRAIEHGAWTCCPERAVLIRKHTHGSYVDFIRADEHEKNRQRRTTTHLSGKGYKEIDRLLDYKTLLVNFKLRLHQAQRPRNQNSPWSS